MTGSKAVTLASIVEVVYEVGAKGIVFNMLPPNDYAWAHFEHDERKLSRWLERISWYEVVTRGNSKTVDPLMGELLLRRSKDAIQAVDDLLTSNPNHGWRQRSVKKTWGNDMSCFSRLSVLFMLQPSSSQCKLLEQNRMVSVDHGPSVD